MTAPASRRDIPVAVTDHAREQARDRFPGFKAARIVDEVRDALAGGRFSPKRPDRPLDHEPRPDTMYCWTPDVSRLYALRPHAHTFVVITVIKPSPYE